MAISFVISGQTVAAFEIGSTSSLQVGFVLGLFWLKLGLFLALLGLNWVCFHQVSNWIYFHNPLYYIDLCSFDFFGNWVCFV